MTQHTFTIIAYAFLLVWCLMFYLAYRCEIRPRQKLQEELDKLRGADLDLREYIEKLSRLEELNGVLAHSLKLTEDEREALRGELEVMTNYYENTKADLVTAQRHYAGLCKEMDQTAIQAGQLTLLRGRVELLERQVQEVEEGDRLADEQIQLLTTERDNLKLRLDNYAGAVVDVREAIERLS